MQNPYANMTSEDEQTIVRDLAHEMGTDALLAIGDVYSIVREELNNAALDRWVADKPERFIGLRLDDPEVDPDAFGDRWPVVFNLETLIIVGISQGDGYKWEDGQDCPLVRADINEHEEVECSEFADGLLIPEETARLAGLID